MPEHSKYNSQNLVNLLPDWLVHFLWFLYEDIPPALRGQCLIFELTTVSGGQRIALRQESPYYNILLLFVGRASGVAVRDGCFLIHLTYPLPCCRAEPLPASAI